MTLFQANYSLSHQTLKRLIQSSLVEDDCSTIHGCDMSKYQSCNFNLLRHFTNSLQSVYKLYLIVHLVPFLIFKLKKTKQNPKKQLKKLLFGVVKSLLFSCGYSAAVIRFTCLFANRLSIVDGRCFSIAAFFGGFTLAFENYSRQSQIAYYTINKGIETAYNLLTRRYPYLKIPLGQCFVMALACGILCHFYFDQRRGFKQRYLNVFDRMLKQ